MKTDRILEDIKSRVDIVDLISGYVQLKRAGQNWKGLCPFHSEKTPSFTVSQSKQMFHCFGCSTGGDIFAFVMKHEHISFQEALVFLARKAGVRLPETGSFRRTSDNDEKVRGILQEASDYFCLRLAESPRAADYIRQRGISDEMAGRFRIGYAPAGWQNLIRHLKGKGRSDKEIMEAGLAVSGSKGPYDMFRDRVMFPITNMSNAVVAFGGRAFGDLLPKYINSPETTVFRKSETLFGLFHAREEIGRQKMVLITEGYLDVIICYQFGFRNAVAPLGTALTADHIRKLRTLADRAVLVFDGDAAGRAAARRALPLICQSAFAASILLLPEKEDPDSYLRKHGEEAFRKLIEKPQSIIEYLFSTGKGEKVRTVREGLGLIAVMTDMLAADEMLTELAETARMSETTLRDELKKIKKQPVPGRPAAAGRTSTMLSPPVCTEEQLLLSAVLTSPDKADYVFSRIILDDLKDSIVAAIFRTMVEHGEERDLRAVLESAGDAEKQLLTRLSVDPGFDPEFIDRIIEDCIARIEKRKFEEKSIAAGRSDDPAMANALLLEKKKLLKGAGI